MMKVIRRRFSKPSNSVWIHGVLIQCLPLFLTTLGCDSSKPMDPELEKLGRATGPTEPIKTPPQMPPGQMGQVGSQQLLSGEILEKTDVPKYTYLRIKTAESKELWSAIPSNQDLKVGQHVELVESVVMKDFTSPSLKKNFPLIVFGFLKPEDNDGGTGMGGMSGMGMGGMGMKAMKGRPMGPKPGMGGMPPGHPPMNAAKGKPGMGGMAPGKRASDQTQ